ncbi:MAG: hypothetical protein WDN69_01010 [Aliidongia sp.]
MLFFVGKGFRVIAHRPPRPWPLHPDRRAGHDMDHYADDLAAFDRASRPQGRSAYRPLHRRRAKSRGISGAMAKAGSPRRCCVSSVPPIMVKTESNPGGLPKEVFDGLQAQLAANRAQFYRDLPAGPFYGFNRPGAKVSEGIIQNW